MPGYHSYKPNYAYKDRMIDVGSGVMINDVSDHKHLSMDNVFGWALRTSVLQLSKLKILIRMYYVPIINDHVQNNIVATANLS